MPSAFFSRLMISTSISYTNSNSLLHCYGRHMVPPRDNESATDTMAMIYNPTFAANYMVGNLGMLDATYSTWFGTESLYVHMINFMPVTAITGELFDNNYTRQEYTKILKPLGDVEMPWRGYVECCHAIVDPQAAWRKARALRSPELDSALSKSQVLYWISTRAGFNQTNASVAAMSSRLKNKRSTPSAKPTSGPECSHYPSCSSLEGDCCPTSGGLFLDCCTG